MCKENDAVNPFFTLLLTNIHRVGNLKEIEILFYYTEYRIEKNRYLYLTFASMHLNSQPNLICEMEYRGHSPSLS